MTLLTLYLTRRVGQCLEMICSRFNSIPEELIVHMAERLVEVNEIWRRSGMRSIQPSELPESEQGEMQVDINLSSHVHDKFNEICSIVGTTDTTLLSIMVDRLVNVDERYRNHGSSGVAAIYSSDEKDMGLWMAAEEGIYAATGDIRPGSGLIWPEDKPFPLSDAECAAVMRGHKVRWRGTQEEYLHLLPGRYEIHDGFLVAR